jgi:hypothetical protein
MLQTSVAVFLTTSFSITMESDNSAKDDDGSASKRSSRKRPAHSTNQGPNRSVVDYDTEDQLREAMTSFVENSNTNSCSEQLSPLLDEIHEGQPVQKVLRSEELQTEFANLHDWVLPKYDPENTSTNFARRDSTITSFEIIFSC